MNSSVLRHLSRPWVLALLGLLAPGLGSAACAPEALVDALTRAPTPASAPLPPGRVPAQPLQAAELAALPALARTESLLGRVGVRWAWHRLEPAALEAALAASGGALIIATATGEGAEPHCQVLTQASQAVQGPAAASMRWFALLPLRDGAAALTFQALPEVVRSLQADFRMAMRVGGQYAPQGAWVVSPWLTQAQVRRVGSADGPPPTVQDSRVKSLSAGVGLTRGLTPETSVTLLLSHQDSRADTSVTVPSLGNLQVARVKTSQEDTLVGLGLYSRLRQESGPLPAVLLSARAFAPSAHLRAGGSASLTSLYEMRGGWALAGTVGVDAERPEVGPARHGRTFTVGASVSLTPQWLLTADAGERHLRDLPGTQPVQRYRLYRSFGALAYLAVVVDREGDDHRTTLTFARPW